jgi:hypothetical protein
VIDLSNFSTGDMLALAKLSSAAYLDSDLNAVEALGMKLIAQIGSAQCQATVATWGGFAVVGYQGTRVTANLSIPEILDDLDASVIQLPGGMRVHKGFFQPMADLWPQIAALMPPQLQPLITGHSLGGVRAHQAKYFCPTAEVVSLGAPKGGDDAFWQHCYPDYPPLRIVNEMDFAPSYPWDGPWTQPSGPAWLHAGSIALVPSRPGFDLSVSDHSDDTGYIAALAALKE